MSFVKVWIHCVWSTKRRLPLITSFNKWDIINHIKENARTKDIYLDYINGDKDHLHCLLSLNRDQALSKTIQLIKGESSFWINKNKLTKEKFEWADEYFAVSVSESQLDKVRDYIKNQEEHHKRKSWQEEYEEFVEKYNFEKLKG
jgi:REP element-mobilizing transposase RayT